MKLVLKPKTALPDWDLYFQNKRMSKTLNLGKPDVRKHHCPQVGCGSRPNRSPLDAFSTDVNLTRRDTLHNVFLECLLPMSASLPNEISGSGDNSNTIGVSEQPSNVLS